MKSSLTIYTVAFLFFSQFLMSQGFKQSNLPILIIDTDNQVIPDEPKIDASFKIIYNGPGIENYLNTNSYHFEGKIGIELRGQSSQHIYDKKGFGIETKDNSGKSMNVSFLGFPKENDWVVHSPYGDKSLIRNALAYYFASQLMDYAPRIQMCDLVLNNEYYGVVLLTEKIKRDDNRVNVSKLNPDEITGDDVTGGYIIKFDKGEGNEIGWVSSVNPIPGSNKETRFLWHYPKAEDIVLQQEQYIRNYISEFEEVLMTDHFNNPETGYQKYIDPSTFIDNIIINEITRNVDGYRLSTYFYKDKESKGGKLKMGPVWDFNLAFGNADYCDGFLTSGWAWDFNDVCPQDYWVNHFWYKRLLEDDNFYNDLAERWMSLRSNLFSNENMMNTIDSFATLLKEPQSWNFERWPILGTYVWPNYYIGNSHASEIDYLKTWLRSRVDWMDSFLTLKTSTNDLSNINKVKVFPNPTQGTIYFESQKEISGINILEIYDLAGRKVYQKSLNIITDPVQLGNDIPKGSYFYRLINNSESISSGIFQLF